MSDSIFQKEWGTSGSLPSDYVSESHVALLGNSAPDAYAQGCEVGEAGERRYPNKDVTKNVFSDTRLPQGAGPHEKFLGTEHESQTFSSRTLGDITTKPETITQVMSSLSPLTP